jgi:hypothetical protein
MWRNLVEPDRSQMAIWRIRIACWIPKATDSDCVIHFAFSLQRWLHESSSMYWCSYFACLVSPRSYTVLGAYWITVQQKVRNSGLRVWATSAVSRVRSVCPATSIQKDFRLLTKIIVTPTPNDDDDDDDDDNDCKNNKYRSSTSVPPSTPHIPFCS